MCSFLATTTQCCIHSSQSTVCALGDSERKSSAAAQASHPMGLYTPCEPEAVPQPHRVHGGTAAWVDGRFGRVCCYGITHRSVLGARPRCGMEDLRLPGNTPHVLGASPHSRQLGKWAWDERLGLTKASQNTAVGIFCMACSLA